MRKIFISHQQLELPKLATVVSAEIIDPEMIKILTVPHLPVDTSQPIYAWNSSIFCKMKTGTYDDENYSFYRVQVDYM